MNDRTVGYGNPPEHSRFKMGVSGNPKGRPKRQSPEVAEVVRAVMDAAVEYREGGRSRRASRRELSVRRYLKRALEGDVGAAAALLTMRAQAQVNGDGAPEVIHICDLLPSDALQPGERPIEESPNQERRRTPPKSSDAGPTDKET